MMKIALVLNIHINDIININRMGWNIPLHFVCINKLKNEYMIKFDIEAILEYIKNHKDWFYIAGIIILVLLQMQTCRNNQDLKIEGLRQQNNISALTDSLNYYINENGNLVAEKHAYQLTQKELEDSIGKIDKKHREYVTWLRTNLTHHDTIYADAVVEHDTIDMDSTMIDKGVILVDTTDVWGNSRRQIKVEIPYYIDSLLRTGEVRLDLEQSIFVTGSLQRDTKTGETYIVLETDYPGIRFNNAMGIVATTSPDYELTFRKRNGVGLFIGPSVGLGYDPIHKTLSPTIGLSLGLGYTFTPKRLQWGR